MALQVWLPLNRDFENKGLLDITPTKLGAAGIINGGPIGCCLSAGTSGQTANGISYPTNLLSELGTHFSASVWVKPNGTHVHYNGTFISSGDWNRKRWAFGVDQNNTKVDVFGPGHNTYVNCSVPVGEWTHLVSTFDDGTGKLYKNGEYVGQYAFGTTAFSSDTTSFTVGRETYANGYFSFNGNIADLRVYDHVLSAKEIKELSKGLYLHYKLSNFEHPIYFDYITEPDGTKWKKIVHHNNPAGGLFAQTDNFAAGVYKDANRWFDAYPLINKTGRFEFLAKQKLTPTSTEQKFRWVQKVSPFGATYDQVKPANVTRITTSGYQNNNAVGGLYVTNKNAHFCIANNTDGNWFGAFGSWTAYNGGTPGVTGVVTTGYMDLYIRVYDTIVPDCSGYGYDGVAFNLVDSGQTTDTVRYDKSTTFASSVAKYVVSPYIDKTWTQNHFTISWWAKCSSMSGLMVWGSATGNRLNLYPSGTYFYWNTGDGTGNTTNVAFASYNGGWHHYVMTGDGSVGRLYIDGVQRGTATTYKPFTSPSVYISGWDLSTSYRWNGPIVDFRLYGTTLSADDVAELYHTAASVDNHGNFFCGELKEV